MLVISLPETVFPFLLTFARLGTMVMLMPALGEPAISSRIRLVLALSAAALLTPQVADAYGTVPASVAGLGLSVISEIAVGFLIGATARLVMSALHVAGTIIAFQSGLAFAMNVDPTQGIQSAIFGSFLSVLGVTLIFASGLYVPLFAAMRESYVLFAPGNLLPVGAFAEVALNTVSGSFRLGVQLAAPFLVFGLVFYLGVGVLSRLMPQVQIFFVAMPANILLGLVLLMLLISAMMLRFLEYFEATIMTFVG